MSDVTDLGSVLLLRCEDCGYELEGEESEISELALSDEAECPQCGGLYDLVEVSFADELQEFTAACRDFNDSCMMIVERHPALRPRVEEMLGEFYRKARIIFAPGEP